MFDASARLFPTPEGLMLAGALIAKRLADGTLAVTNREEEILTLLSSAYGKAVPFSALGYIRHAGALMMKLSDAELAAAAEPFGCAEQRILSGEQFPTIAKLRRGCGRSGGNNCS